MYDKITKILKYINKNTLNKLNILSYLFLFVEIIWIILTLLS